jgi:hypothetical protein
MNKTSNTGLTYGLISGLAVVVITLFLYTGGVETFLSPVAYLAYVVMIVFAVLAARKDKKENGGYLEFAKALKVIFTVFALSLLIQVIFSYILLNFIDTGFRDALMQATLDKIESFMKRLGAPQSEIDKAIDGAAKEDPTSIKSQIMGYAIWCIVFFLVSLIIAAIMKKNKPVFENEFKQ